MAAMRLVAAYWVVGALSLAAGCGGDDEPAGSFGSLSHDSVLGALDGDGSRALCDATEELTAERHGDDEIRRGACLMQIKNDVDLALLNLQLNPEAVSRDLIREDCDAALDRCLDDGPMHRACETVDFEPSCRATVGDYERCVDGSLSATAALAEADCQTFVDDGEELDELLDDVFMGLRACTQDLVDCEGEIDPPELEDPSWSDGDRGFGELEVMVDTASNAEWIDEIEAEVEGFERSDCDAALERDPALDEPAAKLASHSIGTQVDLELEVAAQWKSVNAPTLAQVVPRIQAFLDETSSVCTWLRYGVAVEGEEGESRHVVVLLAE
jgi:hypothetical protein